MASAGGGGVAIVTGSARGLGKEISRALLTDGWQVCIADINEERGIKTAEGFKKHFGDGKVMFHKCDVATEESFKETYQAASKNLGYVSLLVNNAGVGFGVSWRKIYEVNLAGPTIGMNLAFDNMGVKKGGRGGTVLNIASLAGLRGVELSPHYSATKAGLIMLSRTFGTDFYYDTHHVRVLCLCPCGLDTELYHTSLKVDDEAIAKKIKELLEGFPPVDPKLAADIVLNMVKSSPNGHVIKMNPEDGSPETDVEWRES